MIVKNLIEHQNILEKLAHWHYTEWGYLYPEENVQNFIEDLRGSKPCGPLPATWVLMDGEDVWGSASIIEQDMTTNTDLSPWLANVYIHPDKRGLGLGQALIKATLEQCQKRGFEELFLFTSDRECFYESMGWETLKQETYQGTKVSIMTLRFEPSPA